MLANDEDIIRMDEFLHLYRLRHSKDLGYWEFKPWDRSSRLILNSPSFLQNCKTSFFFISGEGWETIPGEDPSEAPKLLCCWGTPVSGASFIHTRVYVFICLCICCFLNLLSTIFFFFW